MSQKGIFKKAMKHIIKKLIVLMVVFAVCGCNGEAFFRSAAETGPTADQSILNELPDTAKFNKELNEYYDSAYIEWNSEEMRYIPIQQSVLPPGGSYTEAPVDTSEVDAWYEDLNEENELDQAILAFEQAYSELPSEAGMLPNPVRYYDLWEGPYIIFAQVRMAELPRLYQRIIELPYHYLNAHMAFSLQLLISRISLDEWDWLSGGKNYKNYTDLNVALLADYRDFILAADTYFSRLDDGTIEEDEKVTLVSRFGTAALPYFYEQIITNEDDRLLPNAHAVLPTWIILREKEQGRMIDASTDLEVVRSLLQECLRDVVGIYTVGQMDISKMLNQ